MSVTITTTAHSLTLAYAPAIQQEPSEFGVQRALAYGITGLPVVTEWAQDQKRSLLHLHVIYLTKANADTLYAMLGETGLVTITIKKEFPATTANPTSYQGAWGPMDAQLIKPLLADAMPRSEASPWADPPSDLQVYEAFLTLVILRNDT